MFLNFSSHNVKKYLFDGIDGTLVNDNISGQIKIQKYFFNGFSIDRH